MHAYEPVKCEKCGKMLVEREQDRKRGDFAGDIFTVREKSQIHVTAKRRHAHTLLDHPIHDPNMIQLGSK